MPKISKEHVQEPAKASKAPGAGAISERLLLDAICFLAHIFDDETRNGQSPCPLNFTCLA